MKHDGRRPGNGWWNCPYPPEWVERMKRAVKVCERLTNKQVEAALRNINLHYKLPPGNFLSEEQDERGIPVSWCREYEATHEEWSECCTAIYDYDSIPETVVTNGKDDWPLVTQDKILTA
jgi:hypothetical protein